MCLFLLLILFGPRLAGVFWWIAAPARWDHAFKGWGWPVLGLLLLPWTTIMFVAVAPYGNVDGADWVWLALGVAADLLSHIGEAYGGRQRAYARY